MEKPSDHGPYRRKSDVLQWARRRDAYREKKGLVSMDELRKSESGNGEYQRTLATEKRCIMERLESYSTKTVAWSIEKHSIVDYPAPFSGTLHLPLDYMQQHGVIKKKFHCGQNLNQMVFAFYDMVVDEDYAGRNYVGDDGLILKRNEYLGPSPRVCGFRFSIDRQEAEIEWWDAQLRRKWIGTTTWKHEVYFDGHVRGWISVQRGDFSCNLDDIEYAGIEL